MGLDMYAYVDRPKAIVIGEPEMMETVEFMYWRKVRQIHNFMEHIWRNKGNEGEFNLVELDLDKPILDTLEMYILNPETHIDDAGFFFGNGELSTEDIQDTMGFIKTAREEVEKGNRVYYSSWW